jgi:hypothetical protein
MTTEIKYDAILVTFSPQDMKPEVYESDHKVIQHVGILITR